MFGPGRGRRHRHREPARAAAARKLATLPLKTVPRRGYEIDLPIGSIARGEYVIEIDASRGADQAKTLVSFRVS